MRRGATADSRWRRNVRGRKVPGAAALNDAQLEEAGAEIGAAAASCVRVIGCGAIAREILAVFRMYGIRNVDLSCLPATLHNRPERIPDAVRNRIRRARAEGADRILIAYADCGTGGALDRVCAEENVERIAGPHCYAFFEGQERFLSHAEEEIGAFYLTDFLARQFDSLVWRGLGLDRAPELRDLYFGNYDRVVYLAQTDDARLDAAARQTADRLGLPLVRRKTGYGELADFVRRAAEG